MTTTDPGYVTATGEIAALARAVRQCQVSPSVALPAALPAYSGDSESVRAAERAYQRERDSWPSVLAEARVLCATDGTIPLLPTATVTATQATTAKSEPVPVPEPVVLPEQDKTVAWVAGGGLMLVAVAGLVLWSRRRRRK